MPFEAVEGDPFAGKLEPVKGDPFAQEAAPKFGLADTWPVRAAKAIYSAVTLPGDVMAGKAGVPGTEEAQSIPGTVPAGGSEEGRIADLTMMANPMSAPMRAGTGWAGVVPKKTLEVPSIIQLKEAAKAGFESPEVADVTIKSSALPNFADKTKLALNNSSIDDVLAPKTFALLDRLTKAPQDSIVTGSNMQTIRRAFGHAASSTDPTERLAATTVMNHLDEFFPNIAKSDVVSGDLPAASKILETARANYSAAKHSETIDNKTVQAELRAAAANSGQNVSNTIRQRLADIILKPELRRGFSPEELDVMEGIVRGSRTENTLRFTGNMMGGGGGWGAAVTGLATAGVAPAVGFGLKQLSNTLSMRQIGQLSELIRSNAPLARSMAEFGDKSQAFGASKTPTTRVDFAAAARNLANNLSGAGVAISARDLIGSYSNQSQ